MRRLSLVFSIVTVLCFARAAYAQESAPAAAPPSAAATPPEAPSAPPIPAATPPEAPAAPAATPPEAPAPPPRFGAQGQFVLGGGSTIGITSRSYDSSAASTLSVTFSPNLDYFVLKNFSVGIDIYANYSNQAGYAADGSLVSTQTTTVYGGPRVGWNLPFGDAVSWWITGAAGMEMQQESGAASTSKDGPYVSLYAPLLVHPVEHFFFGAGPNLWHAFDSQQGTSTSGPTTTIGAGFLVGGYFGGKGDVAPAAEPEPPPQNPADPLEEWHHPKRPRHFGDQGSFLVTNELTLQTAHVSYESSPGGIGSGSLLVGFDYFLVNHFSLGLDVYANFENSTSLDGTTLGASTSYGGAMRVGVQIPLGGIFSVYPRAYVGVGGGSISETSPTAGSSYSYDEAWVAGFVPIVIEPAPHFIFGLGPSISRDIGNTATFANNQQVTNLGTTFGAGFLVGGWL